MKPLRESGPRPDPNRQKEAARYVRSFLWMRLWIGILGVVMPLWLVFEDRLAFDGDPFPRGSLSGYYYSGMRDVFVGTICAIGVFLFTYKISEKSPENLVSFIAGLSAAFVAICPTGPPSSVSTLTPLQDWWGETTVKVIHFVAAGLFIACLAFLTYYFGKREARPGRLSPKFWKWYHWACTGAMLVAIVWIAVTMIVGWPPKALLAGEWLAVWAFGASWFMKGLELKTLRRK